jgi:hypothetical protein
MKSFPIRSRRLQKIIWRFMPRSYRQRFIGDIVEQLLALQPDLGRQEAIRWTMLYFDIELGQVEGIEIS